MGLKTKWTPKAKLSTIALTRFYSISYNSGSKSAVGIDIKFDL